MVQRASGSLQPEVPTQSAPGPLCTTAASAAELRALHRVVSSGSPIKSQQRGEADYTQAQKLEFLADILHRTPAVFLQRFGSVLAEDDLKLFESESDYEVQFYLKELRKRLGNSKYTSNRVKNRRFECLKELMENSSYFSDEAMRERNPLLFEQYVGHYLTEDEKDRLERNLHDMSLSSLIMKNMDIDERQRRLKQQQDIEQTQLEESDSSSDETDEGPQSVSKKQPTTEPMKLSSDPDIAAREKAMLKQELLRAMQLRFMSGQDEDFDYTQVDTNEKYDSLEQRRQDDEDAYFDNEEPEWCGDQGDVCS